MASGIVDALLRSEEPSVQWRVRTEVLGEPGDAAELRRLRDRIRRSDRVRTLLGHRGPDGRSLVRRGIYAKWQGAHWALAALADLGYPAGDDELRPLAEQLLDGWLGAEFYIEFEASAKPAAYARRGVPVMAGRHRRCASQQGNALRSLCRLGLADDRTGALVERLLHWQWPDGGWNCDKNPTADTSSFAETLLPLRGLAAYAEGHDDHEAGQAARRAAEVLLTRRLLYRRSDGTLINAEFTRLHYPLYWHYDVLGGLRGLAELGMLGDPRCADALDLLVSKRLPDGGWPAEHRYYRTSAEVALGHDFVDWGGTSIRRSNPWVTVEALSVLRAAGVVDHAGVSR
ncbi:hypothetical protein [Microlunatus sp. GCM10028923]|uniref:hypothetical protein n=1 Tax=Microlunatus sp. GCM10028923 TaxID=3273400 RepID=UPI00360CB68C